MKRNFGFQKPDLTDGKFWFRRKRYGWGWTPRSWEGWVVTLMAVVLIILSGITFKPPLALLPIFLIVIWLLVICYLTGEPRRQN